MSIRTQIIISFTVLSAMLVLIPGSGKYSFTISPNDISAYVFDNKYLLSVDQVARHMISEDSTVQLIDLRSRDEFMHATIPGAVNIPLEDYFSRRPETYLYNSDAMYIFFSNSNIRSSYAMSLAHGLGYNNCYQMRGGMNKWFDVIMNSTFTGESISPRENALFGTRRRARRLFNDINSLPDSLKTIYMESRRQAERNLDGGCE